LVTLSLAGCAASSEDETLEVQGALVAATVSRVATFPDQGLASFQNALLPGSVSNDRKLRMGSFGSDIFRAHGDQGNTFWMMSDRGPNGQPGGRRTFLVPEFAPVLVHVKVRGSAVDILEALPIVGQTGISPSGLPNLATDEAAFNFDATVPLSVNVDGIDPEALVRTRGGAFWLVEEYRPSLLHLDASGRITNRIVPVGAGLAGTNYPVTESLPALLNKRRANRGFEGLALSADGATMVAAMQSPLEHPTKAIGRASRNLRFIQLDVASQQPTAEFVYQLEEVCGFLGLAAGCGVAPGDMKVSGIAAVGCGKLLVLERTDDVAKVFLVDPAAATNIYGTTWDVAATTPALEALADPATAGVTVLAKTLIVDLSTLPDMPKKIEGVTIINPDTIAVSNDNDFGLVDETTFDADGNLSNDTGTRSQIRYIKLPASLPR
jgi:hypothetical protein